MTYEEKERVIAAALVESKKNKFSSMYSSLADKLVSVQPMPLPKGLIYYIYRLKDEFFWQDMEI